MKIKTYKNRIKIRQSYENTLINKAPNPPCSGAIARSRPSNQTLGTLLNLKMAALKVDRVLWLDFQVICYDH